MVGDDATRFALKTEFFRRVEALGPQQALFPSKGEPINEIVQQMEAINQYGSVKAQSPVN